MAEVVKIECFGDRVIKKGPNWMRESILKEKQLYFAATIVIGVSGTYIKVEYIKLVNKQCHQCHCLKIA